MNERTHVKENCIFRFQLGLKAFNLDSFFLQVVAPHSFISYDLTYVRERERERERVLVFSPSGGSTLLYIL